MCQQSARGRFNKVEVYDKELALLDTGPGPLKMVVNKNGKVQLDERGRPKLEEIPDRNLPQRNKLLEEIKKVEGKIDDELKGIADEQKKQTRLSDELNGKESKGKPGE